MDAAHKRLPTAKPTTGFFPKVRDAVLRIPQGAVATYGDVARAAGFPRNARQVARALHNAPPGLPWHRVLGAGGRIVLTGPSAIEQRLRLEAEGVAFRAGKVLMSAHQFKFRQRPAGHKPRKKGQRRQ